MIKKVAISVCLTSLFFVALAMGEFPADEWWQVDFETLTKCLGPNWQDDEGQWFFLVGLADRVVIVSEGEIVWESPDLEGLVTAVNRVDFGIGEGPEIICATMEDTTGSIHYFGGEDYNEHRRQQPFFRDEDVYNVWDNRLVKAIHVFRDMLPDSSKPVLTINKTIWYDLNDSNTSGAIYLITDPVDENLEEALAIRTPIVSEIFMVNEDQEELIIGWQSSYWSHHQFVAECGLLAINDLIETLRIRALWGGHWWERNAPFQACSFLGMHIVTLEDNEPDVFAAYIDTSRTPHLARWSYEDFETKDQIDLPILSPSYSMTHFSWQVGREEINVLLCISDLGEVMIIDLDNFEVARVDSFNYHHVSSVAVNYDGDEDLELLYLSPEALTLFSVEPLSAPSKSLSALVPDSYSIENVYPNPFNAITSIEYTVPRPGSFALSVYDMTGREITRLAEGMRSFGSYRATWDASGIAGGAYFVRLDGSGGEAVRMIQLVK